MRHFELPGNPKKSEVLPK